MIDLKSNRTLLLVVGALLLLAIFNLFGQVTSARQLKKEMKDIRNQQSQIVNRIDSVYNESMARERMLMAQLQNTYSHLDSLREQVSKRKSSLAQVEAELGNSKNDLNKLIEEMNNAN